MKKIILGLVVIVGLLVSFNGVYAKAKLKSSEVNAIVKVLKKFDVEKSKIDRIINILKEPVVKPPAKSKVNNKCGNGACAQA